MGIFQSKVVEEIMPGSNKPTGPTTAISKKSTSGPPTGRTPATSKNSTGQRPATSKNSTGRTPANSKPPTGRTPANLNLPTGRTQANSNPPTGQTLAISKKPPTKDQLPPIIMKYAILSNLAYSYPTYIFLALKIFDDVLLKLNNAEYDDVNKKQLVNVAPYVTKFKYQNKSQSGVLSKDSRKTISKFFNDQFKELVRTEKTIKKQPGAKSKTSLHSHQFDINHHVNSGISKFTGQHSNFSIIYIHTSDDLSCYIVANASDTENPEIYVLFRGTRSLKNAISDLKGIKKESLCSGNPDNKMKAFAGALHLESEVMNIIFYSIVHIYMTFLKDKCNNRPAQISVTGHSLGGCLCSIFSYYLTNMLLNIMKQPVRMDSGQTGGKRRTKKRRSNKTKTQKKYRGGSVLTYDKIFKLPVIAVAISSPRPFNKELEVAYADLVTKQKIQHINFTSRGDAVTSLPPAAFGMYHPMDTHLEKQGKFSKSSPYNIRSDSIGTLNTSNIKGMITRSNPASHGMIGGISFMDKILGFKIGSDLEAKRGCKILLIQPPANANEKTFKNTSHIFKYSIDAQITSYSAFCNLIAKHMNESQNLAHSINGEAVVGTEKNTQQVSIQEIAKTAHATQKRIHDIVC